MCDRKREPKIFPRAARSPSGLPVRRPRSQAVARAASSRSRAGTASAPQSVRSDAGYRRGCVSARRWSPTIGSRSAGRRSAPAQKHVPRGPARGCRDEAAREAPPGPRGEVRRALLRQRSVARRTEIGRQRRALPRAVHGPARPGARTASAASARGDHRRVLHARCRAGQPRACLPCRGGAVNDATPDATRRSCGALKNRCAGVDPGRASLRHAIHADPRRAAPPR